MHECEPPFSVIYSYRFNVHLSFYRFLGRTAGLISFPDYLVLHMRKFVMEAGWVPKKLGINFSLAFLSSMT